VVTTDSCSSIGSNILDCRAEFGTYTKVISLIVCSFSGEIHVTLCMPLWGKKWLAIVRFISSHNSKSFSILVRKSQRIDTAILLYMQ
jgi:hypothetical protein